jgi:hypothetical protein
VDAAFDKTRPHAVVDACRIGALHDEGTQRACGRCELRVAVSRRDDGDLEAEGAERITHPLESLVEMWRRLQCAGAGEFAPEVLARFAQRFRAAPGGNPLDEKCDELCEMAVGKLDRLELRRNTVDLRRTPGPRTAPTATALEGDIEEASRSKSIETTASDISVDVESERHLGSCEWIPPRTRKEKNAPELRIARRCKPVNW